PTLEPLPSGLPTLQPLPSGLPTLLPQPSGFPTLPPGTPIPTLPPLPGGTSFIFGFVNDENDNALAGVTVTLDGVDNSDSVETDEDGAFEFRDLSAGEFTLTCEKDGYQTYTQSISLGNDEVQEIETIVLEVVVKAKISGYVVNINGDPIENVKIKVKGVITKYKNTAASDADGFFEFGELDGDTYIAVFKKKGYKRATKTVKLDDGEETEIEVEMKKTSKRIIKASAL
ncbi:MAG TPA: carboxypeptidase-like regulatory domain-containing protein, partial [Candidatus Wunengus sp. YC61]|uniref:carboxypeptidase-like regulatory domain-containing protein n=1 Tax=Candidatus Wunengus sp. YC61 TaxID=3367698 RepID=UPI0040287582